VTAASLGLDGRIRVAGVPAIQVQGLCGAFGRPGSGQVVAYEGLDFSVAEGEFVSIVGPSGCGKTTLLNTLAGLTEQRAGEIWLRGDTATSRTSSFGYMFQKDLLFPWRTVRDNIALGLELAGARKSAARQRALDLASRFGLADFLDHYPAQLSGGMRQRVAVMRTLACGRPMLLLDEPFGALDAMTRSLMQEWLLETWSQDRRTVVFVTHDIEEAVFLSDRVLVMSARPGSIKQEIDIPLPRPRSHEITAFPEFAAIKATLIALVYEEGRRAFEQRAEEGSS
jgi:ABC-type nitrate/sulfonate/bicarbonate transport system ATPase subunit